MAINSHKGTRLILHYHGYRPLCLILLWNDYCESMYQVCYCNVSVYFSSIRANSPSADTKGHHSGEGQRVLYQDVGDDRG